MSTDFTVSSAGNNAIFPFVHLLYQQVLFSLFMFITLSHLLLVSFNLNFIQLRSICHHDEPVLAKAIYKLIPWVLCISLYFESLLYTIMICFDPFLISILESSMGSQPMKKSSKSPPSSSSSRHQVKPSDDRIGRTRGNCSLHFELHSFWPSFLNFSKENGLTFDCLN